MIPTAPLPAETRKVILICPLDWGLGHMTRDLPLIKAFRNDGHRVIVAASARLIQWLKKEYPEVETTVFPGLEIKYGSKAFLVVKLIFQLPRLWLWYKKEKRITAGLVKKYRPQLIISDNRYGVRHPSVLSVIITHQLMVKLPKPIKWMEYPVHLVIKKLLQKFNQCWVPDFKKENSLAGDLVHKYPYPKNVTFIGPLSRFDDPDLTINESIKTDKGNILAIISGPEPHRTHLEHKLNFLFRHFAGKVCLIRGTNFNNDFLVKKTPNIEIYNYLPTSELFQKIMAYETILCRSGYSTIMDMYVLNKNMVMVPTPGQTEQEYLAKYHDKKNHLRLILNRKNLSNPFDTLSILNSANHKPKRKSASTIPAPPEISDKHTKTYNCNSPGKNGICQPRPNFREILKNIF